jgi:hypothetical protein
MSRIISPIQKYITFYVWPLSEGVNPKDSCFLPVKDVVWVEITAPTQIRISYFNLKVEINHDTDPEKRVYNGFKEALSKAMLSDDSLIKVGLQGKPISSVSPWPRNSDGSATSTRKPDIWIRSVSIKAPY